MRHRFFAHKTGGNISETSQRYLKRLGDTLAPQYLGLKPLEMSASSPTTPFYIIHQPSATDFTQCYRSNAAPEINRTSWAESSHRIVAN